MKLIDIIERQKDNDNIAIIDANRKYSYKELYSYVEYYSSAIRDKLGGGNIGLYLDNSANFIIAFFVTQMLKNVAVPIPIDSKKYEIKHQITYCDLGLIITDSNGESVIKNAILQKCDIYNIEIDQYTFAEKKINILKENLNDVCLMMKTSGTTSAPKRAMLTHENIISNIKAHSSALGMSCHDRCLIILPMYFSYCLVTQLLCHLYLGASVVIYQGACIPSQLINEIKKCQCTNIACVPSIIMLLKDEQYLKLHCLRYVLCGGSSLSTNGMKIAKKVFGEERLVITYGLTEAGPRVTTLLPYDISKKIGSVGKPLPGIQLRIEGYVGEKQGPDYMVGEVLVKSPGVMKGYYKRNVETENILKEGWLYTGDLGYVDEDGYLYIVGRKKNVIISAGLNIYPEEIEEVLKVYPNVEEAYVYGCENELLGEVPVADIVIEESSDFSVGELKIYLQKVMDIKKIPRQIYIVDKIEKTNTGKIRRRKKI